MEVKIAAIAFIKVSQTVYYGTTRFEKSTVFLMAATLLQRNMYEFLCAKRAALLRYCSIRDNLKEVDENATAPVSDGRGVFKSSAR